jgi:predicted peptidase
MKRLLLFLLLLPCLSFGMRERKVIKGTDGTPNGYIEFLPNDYDGFKKFPTLIWWSGLGETGDGSLKSLTDVIGKQGIAAWLRQNEVGFIVLLPQDANGWGKASPFVRWALSKYVTINKGALHMAGLSSGGYMVRDFINEGSEEYKLFSSFTPMATNLDGAIPNVKRIVDNNQYVWAHAGEVDGDPNKPSAQARFIKALQTLAPTRGQLTVYKGMGHSAWNETYDASGKAAIEITAITLEGAVLFKWVDKPVTWWQWMLDHSKDLSIPPVIPPVNPPPVSQVIFDFYYKNDSVFFVLEGSKQVFKVKVEQAKP